MEAPEEFQGDFDLLGEIGGAIAAAVAMEVEDTESSSDDENMLLELDELEGGPDEPLQKVEGFYEQVIPAMTDQQYKENFRLNRGTVDYLVELIGGDEVEETGKPMEFKILLFLYYLGSIISFRKVALLFNVSVSSAWTFVDQVVSLLCCLKETHIQFSALDDVMNGFLEKTGIHGIIGAVDGCHLPIQRPSQHEHAYVNRKHTH